VSEKFSSVKKVHNEIELRIGLKSVVKLDDERAFNLLQDIPLG